MSGPTHLVVLGAERTGSNLLVGLIDSHPKAFVGGELFNPRIVDDREVPWPVTGLAADVPRLSALRASSPGLFLREVLSLEELSENDVIGFKLFYYHAVLCPEALSFVQSDPAVKVVHIKRRNRLARLVSIIRAEQSDIWGVKPGERLPEVRPVEIESSRLIQNFEETASREQEFAELLSMHPILDVFYEDLAIDPQSVAESVLEFLDLRPTEAPLEVRYQKTGSKSLRSAISNYDQLKEQLGETYDFFDE